MNVKCFVPRATCVDRGADIRAPYPRVACSAVKRVWIAGVGLPMFRPARGARSSQDATPENCSS